MRKIIILAIGLAAAAAAQDGFQPAEAVHIEPLGEIDITPGAVFSDTVILMLTIDAEGRVTDVEIWSTSGYTNIDDAALEAASKCLFKPATQDGEPIESTYQIYYRLSAYRTREYLTAEEKAGTTETESPPETENDGRD
jgi:TonB family protein